MSSDLKKSSQFETYPFVMSYLPDFFREKRETELCESPKKITQKMQEFRDLIQNHKLSRDNEYSDDFLLQYLRNMKYDVSRAFKRLTNYLNFVNAHPHMFQSVDIEKYYPPGIFLTPLPRRCPEGCTIILLEFGKWDPEVLPMEVFETLAVTVFCQALRDPMTQVNGYKIIFDFTGTSFKHLKYFTPQEIYIFYHGLLDCLPGRHQQILVVQNSTVAKVAYTIFKGFATKKLRKRLVLISSPEDLLEHFPPSTLPVQYGGHLTDYHMKEWWMDANERQGERIDTQHNLYYPHHNIPSDSKCS